MWPKLTKEISSKTGELHFKRWAILETKWFNIYLHKIYKSDEDKHPHNHPWNFWSLILWGSYKEELWTYDGFDYIHTLTRTVEQRKWLSLAKRETYQYHKITLTKPVLTLVITGKRRKEWGYLKDNKFCDNEEYRRQKNYEETINKREINRRRTSEYVRYPS